VNDQCVKGSHITQAQRWVDQRLGEGTFKSLTKNAGPRWGVILPGTWYEVAILHEALDAAAERAEMSVEDITTEIAARNAEEDLSSLYRIFLRVANPRTVLSLTPKLWTTYVNFASAKAVLNETGHYIGRGEGFSQDQVEWACGCWRGFIPAAIKMAGGKSAKGSIIKRARQAGGLHVVEFEVRYG
jgi:hypothetical protein